MSKISKDEIQVPSRFVNLNGEEVAICGWKRIHEELCFANVGGYRKALFGLKALMQCKQELMDAKVLFEWNEPPCRRKKVCVWPERFMVWLRIRAAAGDLPSRRCDIG